MTECAAKGATCNFFKKLGHVKRTCRATRNSRGRQSVGMIQGQEDHNQYDQKDMDKIISQQEKSMGLVITPPPKQHHS